jgi:alanine racemase
MSNATRIDINLARVRDNTREIRREAGILAVVKSDAYGLGIRQVTDALAPLVDGWCVFSLDEAVNADLWARTGKPTITIGPPQSLDPRDYLEHHVHPAVSTPQQAEALRPAQPILSIDTGMQRFACPREEADQALNRGGITEAMTHATRLEHVKLLKEIVGARPIRLHAASSSLLHEPEAHLDAVRPGLALYQGAVSVTSPLVEVRMARGPAGYSGFSAEQFGVVICGYSNGLRKGPCLVNGRPQRVIEVGMQSSFVTVERNDTPGDPVTLLGDGLTERRIADDWGTSPQEVLVQLCRAGTRNYLH